MTLFERLSRLSHNQAVKLLGDDGQKLIIEGGKRDIDLSTQVILGTNLFRLTLPDAIVSIVDDEKSREKLRIICSSCDHHCEHAGAAFAVILEEKSQLGLACTPETSLEPITLSEHELVKRELLRRIDRANRERFVVKPVDSQRIWTGHRHSPSDEIATTMTSFGVTAIRTPVAPDS